MLLPCKNSENNSEKLKTKANNQTIIQATLRSTLANNEQIINMLQNKVKNFNQVPEHDMSQIVVMIELVSVIKNIADEKKIIHFHLYYNIFTSQRMS